MRKTLAATAFTLAAFSLGHAQEAAPAAAFNSSATARVGEVEIFTNAGNHPSAGHCVTEYALIAAHAELRENGAVIEGWCKKAGAEGGKHPEDFQVVCDGNRDTAAADRLFAAGRTLYLEKQAVTVSEADVKAICTTTPANISPETRMAVPPPKQA